MNAGSVFFDRKFEFHDGETGRKLFIVLGTSGGVSVAVKTTTQQHGRGTIFGCQLRDRFPNFFLPLNCCDLDKTTWVCMDEFYELDYRDVLKKSFGGIIDSVCDLPKHLIRELQDCALMSDDISVTQQIIVKNCLV